MVLPAGLFVAVNFGHPSMDGWGVPVATDIAFAVALIAVFGSRVPRPLKLFLLTLAIVDDIGAIVVIALFYSHGVAPVWLLGGALVVAGMVGLRRVGVSHPLWYVVPGALLWYCMLESSIQATLAGVILGLLTPTGNPGGRRVIEQLEHRLHPWSSLVVVPLFALASAGVVLDVHSLQHAATSSTSWGVVLGLVVGKPVGILLATIGTLRFGLGRLPGNVSSTHLVGAACLAGIGFTVSLFVAELAFAGPALRDAKIGILVASLTSAAVGGAVLTAATRRAGSGREAKT